MLNPNGSGTQMSEAHDKHDFNQHIILWSGHNDKAYTLATLLLFCVLVLGWFHFTTPIQHILFLLDRCPSNMLFTCLENALM